MFAIQLIVYLNIISLIIAQMEYNNHHLSKLHENNDLIIKPPNLTLRSTDTEGIFYCNSRVELYKQRRKLMASIENPILASPKFILKTKQMNSTTIRIRIIPNGYIGMNRIICHWKNNLTFGQTADLTIGENPGNIILPDKCLAYDRRYIQCILRAPIIGRAFRNGFPRLYTFPELSEESSPYRPSPELFNITNENELVFHFKPRDQNIIPKKILMTVNMTLVGFGSSLYSFNIEPIHTTNVDFRIEDISSKKFTISISHNNTGTISQRLCSGDISEIDDQDRLVTVQDVTETSNQKILITRLRSSTQYEICLRCFYERTDQSFKEKKCVRIKTITCTFCGWHFILVSVLVAIVLSLISVTVILFCRTGCASCRKQPTVIQILQRVDSNTSTSSDSGMVQEYDQIELEQEAPLITYNPIIDDNGILHPDTETYNGLDSLMEILTGERKVSPDTVDLSRQEKA